MSQDRFLLQLFKGKPSPGLQRNDANVSHLLCLSLSSWE